MNLRLKILLLLGFAACALVLDAQTPKPTTAPKKPQAPPPTVFDRDTRASVRSFKDALKEFFADTQDATKSDQIPQDLRELRFAANARTATTMLNPGLAVAAVSSALSGLPSQVSAQPQSSGSTSLVSKAGGSSILAFAVDAGALTQSVSGTTSTVSGNLEGIGSLLSGQSAISIDPNHESALRKAAGDVNLMATFALDQPSSQTTTSTQPVTGSTPPAGTQVNIPSSVGKLTGITAQFTIHNPFNPHSAAFRSNWTAAVPQMQSAANTVLQAASPVVTALDCTACQADWTDAQAALLKAASEPNASIQARQQAVADAFDHYVNQVLSDARKADSTFDTDFTNAVKATAAYQQASKTALDNALGNLFTFEYDFAKPANQPETHDFKLVYGYAMTSASAISSLLTAGNGGKSLFTANLDVSIYGGAIPASGSYGRIHYGQASAEFDRPIAGSAAGKQAVFSAAGYWQYQPSPSVLTITQSNVAPGTSIDAPTQVLVGTAGSLFVTQAKITIGNGKSGVNVPIGVKWSNKTDLLTGTRIGGQVGISYDFSSLSSLFGGGS
jgi:hypothetical protein